ncbi:hypothetical protein ABW19_dt0207834 [Dactylella cylindrospora]|nr:hypothetical protein ABW19_dt0207834 [Dactylella cylindrospora]
MEDQTTALAKRRAEGFKVIGPIHDYYCDFAYPAAEGRITVPLDKWTIGGVTVGLGTLRLTSISLVEYRNEETTTKRDKGKGKAQRVQPTSSQTIFIDGEEMACEPLPLGRDSNLLSDDEHLDGVPDLVDRYCWRPHFPVPHYNELNKDNISISPQNLSFAFQKTYIQDALLGAGLPVPPEAHIYWNGPNFGPPPSTPPLRVSRNRDELNVMEYFDFGGPAGKYLRRLLSIKAFYASHTNGAARGVSGFEFTYEMDEEDVKECKLREDSIRPQERYVEVRRGGVDLHYLSCAAMIDGKGGERIVKVGTRHLCLGERSYLGVMFITNFGRKLEFPACLPPTTRRRSRRRLRRPHRVYPLGGHPPPPPPGGGDDDAGPAPRSYIFSPPLPAPPPPPPFVSTLAGSSGHSGNWPINNLSSLSSMINGTARTLPRASARKGRLLKATTTTNVLPSIVLTADDEDTKTREESKQEETAIDSETQGEGSKENNAQKNESSTAKSEEGTSDEPEDNDNLFSVSSNVLVRVQSPDLWDDPFTVGVASGTSTGKSEDAKTEMDDTYETSTTYDFFDIDPNTLITGFFGCTDGKPYLGEGLKAFGVVTQTPSESERGILEARDVTKLGSPDELEAGAPIACFSQLERAKYWKKYGDEDVIKDFVNKVTFDEPIARIRVFCRPAYHLFSGYSRHAANGVGLIFEYHSDDLIDDGCGGLRPRAARVLGELREENAAGSFELEKDEHVDAVWVWCADRSRVVKNHVNELGYRGADIIAALRFRTDKGKTSKIFGGERTGTCHFFESSGKRKLVGLRMTYDYMSDWISPIWRDEDEPVSTDKPDLRIRHIPFGWSVLNRPMSHMQLFADAADHKDFGPDQIQTIKGYFDYQFRGVAFIYKSGDTRSFGKCVGASTDFNLENGERIFALRYRPGTNFALHFSLAKVNPETGEVTIRSTPLFGIDAAGFGLPPLNEHVRDPRTWRHVFEDEVKPLDRDYNYSTDESSDYNNYQTSTRHPLEDSYENRHNDLRSRTATSMETNIVQGHFKWDENGFVDIRPPKGYDFAGLWLQEIDLDFKLGMMITAALDPKAPEANIDYSMLTVPAPQSSLLSILDPHVDADDATSAVKTFNGRPFVPPLPWLGAYPTDKLPGDAVLSRKIGAQIGAVRLFASYDKAQMRDICVYYSFPTRLVHIHGIEFIQNCKYNKQTGYYTRDPDVTRFGTTGFMTTLNKATKYTIKFKERKMVGLKVNIHPTSSLYIFFDAKI